MNLWLELILLTLASFRLTMLVVMDTFPPIAWVRTKIQHARPYVKHDVDIHHEGKIHTAKREDYWWLGELLGCVWCASAYVSGGTVLVVWALYGLPQPVLCWLAVWGGAAWLASAKT